jgi:hypothetical protein
MAMIASGSCLGVLGLFFPLMMIQEPDRGTYQLSGRAFTNDSMVISSDTLQFITRDDTSDVLTDRFGRYSVTVTWSTWDMMVRHDVHGNLVDIDSVNEDLNPPATFLYRGKSVAVSNAWRAERLLPIRRRGGPRYADLFF